MNKGQKKGRFMCIYMDTVKNRIVIVTVMVKNGSVMEF